MTEQKHTPEPWKVVVEKYEKWDHNPNAWPRLFSGDFEIVGTEGFYSDNLRIDKANARRIVACVNACTGIPTKQLEKISRSDAAQVGVLISSLFGIDDEDLAKLIADKYKEKYE